MIKQLLFLAPFTLFSVTAYCAQTTARASTKPKPPALLKLVNGDFPPGERSSLNSRLPHKRNPA